MPELLEAPTAPGWAVCPSCPPDDNRWPAEAFRAWHNVPQAQSRPKKPCCNDCLFRRYPKCYRPCATCGKPMHFRSDRHFSAYPQCMRCRHANILACARCKAPLEGRAVIDGRCVGCYLLGGQAEATCTGCGCTDSRACPGGCWWITVDRLTGVGICSSCTHPQPGE